MEHRTYNNISYSKVGSGPHLCFLHGFCENAEIWDTLIAELSASYTCISIDLPGFGKSGGVGFGSMPEEAQRIHALLTQEDALHTTLFGHSMGGYLLAEYLAQYGDSMQAAAFIHSTAYGDTKTKKINRQKTIDFIRKHGADEFFRLFVPSLVAIEHLGTLRDSLTQMVTQTKTQSILDGLQAMMQRPNHVPSLGKFEKPVLFLRGEQDKHYSPYDNYKEASECHIAQVSVIKSVGHLSMYEDAPAVLKVVNSFLQFVEQCK